MCEGENQGLYRVGLDRYEQLINVVPDNLVKGKYTIFEKDSIKGIRITIVDSITEAIIRETI